jgi:hypothetical protein
MNKTVKTECGSCQSKTFHSVLGSKRMTTILDEDGKKSKEYSDYMIVECKGCGDVSFLMRMTGKWAEGVSGEGQNFFDINFPEIGGLYDEENSFLSAKEQMQLPVSIRRLYYDLESSFEYEISILAGVGLRMMVEAICIDQKIPGQNLQVKIQNLHTKGFISASERPILDKLRLIGNISAHEIKAISISKLNYALGIVNHVLKSIYILPKINKKLKI